jgi:hypothetical protein
MSLAKLTDWLFGCAHRNTSFPRTPKRSTGAEGEPASPADTYVTCLECGRHVPYDWATMRKKRFAWARTRGAR